MGKYADQLKDEHFHERLYRLRNEGYIDDETYTYVKKQDQQYKEALALRIERQGASDPVKNERPKPAEPVKKVKKQKSPEEVRERNITWSLILGVALLLMTGVIIATSQWDQLGPGAKLTAIIGVSLFFFALSYGTKRVLGIEKTAFAFLTLGSLLIPVAVLAAGYFELFGRYYSMDGEGRYILGMAGALIPLPLYIRHALVYRSRLYVWIALIFMSMTAAFTAGALPVGTDGFYLIVMMYNAALLGGYIRFSKQKRWQLFTRELPVYTQLHLVLSTLFMLFFFEEEVFHSFNLLLTAAMYMAMVFVYGTKEYQFVFSAMLAYAVYQLVEHTPLQQVEEVLLPAAGLLYLGFAYAVKQQGFVKKMFHYISGVVSICAFIYITFQSLQLRAEQDSWLLLAAYIIIMLNYLLLAVVSGRTIFKYLTPVFYMISAAQLWSLIDGGPMYLFVYFAAAVLCLVPGLWGKGRWIQPVQFSSFFISLLAMAACITLAWTMEAYGHLSLQFLVSSALAVAVYKKGAEEDWRWTAQWFHPTALLISMILIYQPMTDGIPGYGDGFGYSFHLACSGLLLFAGAGGWRFVKEKPLEIKTFYIGQGTYITAMALLLFDPLVDPIFVRPLLLFIGLFVTYGLTVYGKKASLWIFPALTTAGFYLSLISPLPLAGFEEALIYSLFAPVLLLVIADKGKVLGLGPSFYRLAHGMLPVIIGLMWLTTLGTEGVHPLFFLVPLVVYSWSARRAEREYGRRYMLYAAAFLVYVSVYTLSAQWGLWTAVPGEYAFMITTVILGMVWAVLSPSWRKRLDWFLIPFSIVGLALMMSRSGPTASFEIALMSAYVVITLVLIHFRRWWYVLFLPLLLTLLMWDNIGQMWGRDVLIPVLAAAAVLVYVAGWYLFRSLIPSRQKVDAYAFTALMYIGFLTIYTAGFGNVWVEGLPLLLTGAWMMGSASRWKRPLFDKVSYTVGSACFYGAYLWVLAGYRAYVPDLLEAELYTLPLLFVLYLLRKRTWHEYRGMMNHVQSALLLFIAAYLVSDAILSHTIWDAWIIGGLSVLSMLAGMQLKIKSYFFTGMGVLIFNVIYQTKPYWGRAPWWVYLLTAGLLLIGTASYNEWQKQQSGKEKPVERKLKKWWLSLKQWD
ncbi:hypothetical protein GLW03_11250 [Halobacillus halophilus]|uniref:SCO7613 C-terminal domain-containing membrane protein n=1 Tax=Halobacillus halophilus TaxID=1570 RepID=UPI001368A28E|nr:hypothetical protein [Halobacillus halophilus]MYL30399.1 hypothetical protein [Halobacillus halophilus]